jgi:hypothetical protein
MCLVLDPLTLAGLPGGQTGRRRTVKDASVC